MSGEKNRDVIATGTDAKPPVATKRHEEFYFDDTLVVFQIEDTLFNVHKYQLMKSKTFSDMFNTAHEDPDEGSTPENPIVLEGVSADEFSCLLAMLYAPCLASFCSYYSAYRLDPYASDIISAFRLANMWKFDDLRSCLHPIVEKELDDVDKILFARLFDIKEWLVPALTNLCKREEPITEEEAQKLGISSVLLIFRLREELCLRFTPRDTCSECVGYDRANSGVCYKCQYKQAYLLSPKSPISQDASIKMKVEEWVADGCAWK